MKKPNPKRLRRTFHSVPAKTLLLSEATPTQEELRKRRFDGQMKERQSAKSPGPGPSPSTEEMEREDRQR